MIFSKSTKTHKPKIITKLLSRSIRFHISIVLLAAVVIGAIFTVKTLTVHADSSGIISSGQIPNGTTSAPSTIYVYFTAPSSGALTLSLSYTGVAAGYADMTVSMGGEHLTESTYGNPIVVKFNAAANTQYLIAVGSSNGTGTYSLSYTLVDNSQPATIDPFWSMPCFYTPLWDLPPGIGNADLMSACPAIPSPDTNTSIPPAPADFRASIISPSSIRVEWQGSSDPTIAGYRIYKGTSSNNLTYIATRPNYAYPGSAFYIQHPPSYYYFNTYDDTELDPATAYYYAVVAFTANNVSTPSKISATTDPYVTVTGNTNSNFTSGGNSVSGGSALPGPSGGVKGGTNAPSPPVSAYLSVAAPANGATITGIYQVWGEASKTMNELPVTSIQIEIDNNGFVSTSGTVRSWFYLLNTRLYSNTVHTITVKVINSAGQSWSTWSTVTFKNGSYSATAPTTQGVWISPEGMKISVDSKGKNPHTGQPWTIADVYYMVRACAAGTGDFDKIASGYAVTLNDTVEWIGLYYDFTMITAQSASNQWVTVNSTTYLNGATGSMLTQPYNVSCYEYNHAWTESYYYLVDYPSSTGVSLAWEAPPNYLNERWVNASGTVKLANEFYHCLNFIDSWDGCISDDRRILFGGPGANGGSAAADLVPGEPVTSFQEPVVPFMIGGIIAPQYQPDLSSWYTSHWITGK